MSGQVKIQTLSDFFQQYKGENSIQLDQCTFIENIYKFTETHFGALKANPGNKTMMPYYHRLVKLYNLLKQKL